MNVRKASPLNFLRIRARIIRSVCERLWRCQVDGDNIPFLYDSKETYGDGDSRIKKLRGYAVQHARVVEDLLAKVER